MYIRKVFFVALIFFSVSASAQRFKPGIVLGAVTSDLVGIDPYDNDFHKGGFIAGGSLSTKINDKVSFQFEIQYVQKGSFQTPDSANNYTYYKLNLDYVEIPLIFRRKIKFNVSQKPIERFFIEGGFSYGRLVRINQSGTSMNGGIYDDTQFRKSEIALNLGVGCKIINNLSCDIRYTNSIIPVINNKQQLNSFFWYTFNKGDNILFSFTLRYVFGTEKEKNE